MTKAIFPHRSFLILAFCLVWMLLLATDANGQIFGGFGKNPFARKKDPPIPTVFNQQPGQQDILGLLQQRNTAFRQLSSDIRVSLDGVPKLRGTMQLELPRRLRVKAGVIVDQFGVDVGSNDDIFWVWTKVNLPNQKPAILYASHEDFANRSSQVRGAIPLEPVWLVESLGLIKFQENDVHHGPVASPEGFLKMYTVRNNPAGKTTRVTTIHPTQGLVLQQALYDSEDNLIAYTDSKNYKWYADRGIALPEEVVMYMYQGAQRARMVIDFGKFEFDTLFGDPKQMWSIQPPANVQTIDLSRLPAGN